jgi:hypothetical protein
LEKSTSYEGPHYAVFSNLPSFHLSSVQIFSSAPCSQTPSVYVPPLMSETKFHTHTEPPEKIIVLYILMFMFVDSTREDKRDLNSVLLKFVTALHVSAYSAIIRCVVIRGKYCAFRGTAISVSKWSQCSSYFCATCIVLFFVCLLPNIHAAH